MTDTAAETESVIALSRRTPGTDGRDLHGIDLVLREHARDVGVGQVRLRDDEPFDFRRDRRRARGLGLRGATACGT